jgi:RimJ/RimL family protein N-acetyltransferase
MKITTERLILRRFRRGDFADLAHFARDKMAADDARYDSPWPTDDKGVKGALRFFMKDDAWFAVQLPGGPVIGFVTANRTQIEAVRNLGYAIRTDHQNHGYAYEACAAVMEYYGHEGVTEFIATTADALVYSVKLLKKLGFTERETLSGGEFTATRYGKKI